MIICERVDPFIVPCMGSEYSSVQLRASIFLMKPIATRFFSILGG